MTTKKINLNELRTLVKQIIKEESGGYFQVDYYNFGQRYTEKFTHEEAKEELIKYGFPKKEVDKMSDRVIKELLGNIFNP
jgi:hypothetical protein